ncbi:hypothetical protein NDR87_02020 [Nocardia sp. CDC159]|uniref:Uncharacterized protein n=1 Tax=Nocardia pulmonis TaxID=2951408 RepID=A0A9X2E607_9NOCA|nr:MULTISPECIES: hypothetical protein [Nocardia]MCM6772213.1 hypothetical protein [Nocardia pulmonis]MCM6785129.1 hypothetical protein [Nocardia sp. CDC159]
MTFVPLPNCERQPVPAPPGGPYRTQRSFNVDDGTYETVTLDLNGRVVHVRDGVIELQADDSRLDTFTFRWFDPATCRTTGYGQGTEITTKDKLVESHSVRIDTTGRITEYEYVQKRVDDDSGVQHFVIDTTTKVTQPDGHSKSDRMVDDWGNGRTQIKEHYEEGRLTDRSAYSVDRPGNPAAGNQSSTTIHYNEDGGATIRTQSRDEHGTPHDTTTRVDKHGNPIESPLADDDPAPRPAQPNPLATGEDEPLETPEFRALAENALAEKPVAVLDEAVRATPRASVRIGNVAVPNTSGMISHDDVLAHVLDGLYPDM